MGALLSSMALVVFLLVMTNGHRIGWSGPLIAPGFGVVVLLALAFVWWESHTSTPMLDLAMFRQRLFTMGSSASFLGFLAGTSVFFLMPFYLQDVLGFSPGASGLIIAPTAVFFAAFGFLSGRLTDRFGWQPFALAGLVLSAASLLILSQLTSEAPTWLVVVALAMQGMGMGTFFSPNASAVLSTVDRSRYGIATAYMNMVRNAANVTGVGVATTIVTAIMATQGFEPSLEIIRNSAGGEGVKLAFTQGLRTTYLIMFGFVAGSIVLSLYRTRTSPTTTFSTESEHNVRP